jgi:hypothetical protein
MKFTKKMEKKIFKKCNHSFQENLLKKKIKKNHILFYLNI